MMTNGIIEQGDILYKSDGTRWSAKHHRIWLGKELAKVQAGKRAGCLLYVEPIVGDSEKLGDWKDNNDGTCTHLVVSKTQDELAAELLAYRQTLTCSAWQLRKALNSRGKRGQVTSFLATADQATKDGWDAVSTYERLHPLSIALGQSVLSYSETELDEFFEFAATL